MSNKKRFQEEPPTAKWVAEDAGAADRFPDKLQVRQFAERLLQQEPEGAYELVRSERRSSLNQPSSREVRARVPDDTTSPALGPRTQSVPASSPVAEKVRQPGLPAQNTPQQSADSAAQTRPPVPPNGDQAPVEVSVQGVPQVHGTSQPAEANGLLVPSVFASDRSGQQQLQPKASAGRAQ